MSNLELIEKLDPVENWREVMQLFNQDFARARVFHIAEALMLTFAAPSMSKILHDSGAFYRNYERRMVEQALLGGTMVAKNFAPGPGRDALRRMNTMHRQYDIRARDFVLVGCESSVMHIRHADRYGFRSVSVHEKIAMTQLSLHLTRHMGIRSMPQTFEEQTAFFDAYHDTDLAFAPQNHTLAAATLEYFSSYAPVDFRPLAPDFLACVFDARITRACGLDVPDQARVAEATNDIRAYASKPLAQGERTPLDIIVGRHYPNGFDVNTLGTHLDQPAFDESVRPDNQPA